MRKGYGYFGLAAFASNPFGAAGAGQEPAGGGGFRCLPCRAVRGAPALFGGRKVSQVRPDSAEMSPAASLAGEGGIRMR